jgi:hypothetical protein
MPNKITREEYPDIWDALIEEEDYDATEKSHRRGSTFYITMRFRINSDELFDYGIDVPSELNGLWEADPCTWSDEWGLDSEIDTLYRVEEKEEVIVKKSWVRVK